MIFQCVKHLFFLSFLPCFLSFLPSSLFLECHTFMPFCFVAFTVCRNNILKWRHILKMCIYIIIMISRLQCCLSLYHHRLISFLIILKIIIYFFNIRNQNLLLLMNWLFLFLFFPFLFIFTLIFIYFSAGYFSTNRDLTLGSETSKPLWK